MKYIFDVDGTLTPSRQVIDSAFEAFMIKFCCSHDVYLVTGSDRQKTVDQLGLDICYRAKRVYNCSGADVWAVSYTHLTLPTNRECRSRWSPYH